MAAAAALAGDDALRATCAKALAASLLGRHAVAVTLYRRAKVAARELHGPASLVPVFLLARTIRNLVHHAELAGVPPAAAAVLREEACVALFTGLDVLERRAAEDTLLPGRCLPHEVALFRWWQDEKRRANAQANVARPDTERKPSERRLVGSACEAGGSALVQPTDCVRSRGVRRVCDASRVCAAADPCSGVHAPPKCALSPRDHVCILCCGRHAACVGALADLRSDARRRELEFAEFVMRCIEPSFDPFRASLRDKLAAPAMRKMLCARGLTFSEDDAKAARALAAARRVADLAEHGLRACALPGCGLLEACVKHFKFCSRCCSAWYCSEEHAVQHWKEHKKVCRPPPDDEASAAAAA